MGIATVVTSATITYGANFLTIFRLMRLILISVAKLSWLLKPTNVIKKPKDGFKTRVIR